MNTLLQDVRFAARLLLKQRGFTAAALLTLALCIGANTAMFSVVNSVLLRPLPFPDSERLVLIFNTYPQAGVERGGAGVPDYYDRLEQTTAFDEIAMVQGAGMTVGEPGRPERIQGSAVTPSFFRMLGVPPVAGRAFTDEEGEPGAHRQAVLSYGYWQEGYGGAADAVGSSIRINDVAHTIVGVMPRHFMLDNPDVRVWVPLAFTPEQRADDRRHSNSWSMMARLKPGISLAQAQTQIDAVNAANEERFPQFRDLLRSVGFTTKVVNYRDDLTREVRGTLWLLQAGVLFVLLIGCVNIANLILVRSTARHRELATRAAIGAAQTRLVRQLLTESSILAVAGGLLGLVVGWAGVRGFAALVANELPRGAEITLDATVMAAALAISIAAGLLFGAIPVARLLRADLSAVFRDEGRTGTAGRSTGMWRGALVVAQVSLAFALMIGAGLLVTSFARTLRVEPGFEPAELVTASVALPVTRYADAAARRQFTDMLLERVRAVPGVTHAGATNVLLFGTDYNASAVTPEGYVPRPEETLIAPINSVVSDGYHDAMQIGVVAGRSFNRGDGADAPAVAIVDQLLAERFWPGQDPIGRRIAQGVPELGAELEYRTVVGVVRNVRVMSLTGDQPPGHFYVPLAQAPVGRLFVTVRSPLDPAALTTALRAVTTELDPDLPMFDVRTMEERIAVSVSTERARMWLLAGFGGIAMFLAAIGLYGVLAWTVTQRTPEIGIRMALGSTAGAVFGLVLQQGARLVALGLAIGLAASYALARLVQSMLYDVAPTEPVVYALVLALLAITALVACAVPARRAARVDPMVAIRE